MEKYGIRGSAGRGSCEGFPVVRQEFIQPVEVSIKVNTSVNWAA